MRKRSSLKIIGYSAGAAVVFSLLQLLIGMLMFGANFTQWSELQGGIVSTVATVAGTAGAVFGLFLALRTERYI
ncbi:MAG TPA: hypothetical protein VJM12_02365 [Pyrinomonadaceae bacterium]|nr:hypothetical protein [Pyrinomonadaceae bacterium]